MGESPWFFDEFIDDYFSECEEHLATIRRVLLSIEAERPPFSPVLVHDLSRALHTVKGLSGMVGLGAAEQTAHAMEDCVRFMAARTAGDAPHDGHDIDPEPLIEELFTGEQLLERVIEARRSSREIPSADSYSAHVRALTHRRSAVETIETVDAEIIRETERTVDHASGHAAHAEKHSGGAAIAIAGPERRFEFVPSPELASRGIGVELIRRRLAMVGALISTTPRVRPTGGVAFDFVVALNDPAFLPPASWQADGLTWGEAPADPQGTEIVLRGSQAPAAAAPRGAGVMSNTVRVDLTRLDDLMRLVADLVAARARLDDALARAGTSLSSGSLDELHIASETIDRQLRSMREGVMRIRLVPVAEVFERMRFAMRDIARETGKVIRLEVSGQDTEIDKLVVDRLLEPLLHLVRNAASHGIEPREERLARGKPAEGTIALRASAAGDRILIHIEDDGAGIDVDRVARRGHERGLVGPGETVSPDIILDVICAPGFSTRDDADLASGRGVGMGVVRSTIRALAGELFVSSVSGQGTRFTIELPLTLMITDALIVRVGDQTMAIPQIALREIVPRDESAVTRFENNVVLSYRGRVIPLLNLAETFHLSPPPNARVRPHVLIVGDDAHLAGLVADEIIGLREIVVHPVADPFVTVPGIAGATELADGRVSLILDASALVRRGRTPMTEAAMAASVATQEHAWS